MIGEACGKPYDPSYRTRSQRRKTTRRLTNTAQNPEAGGRVGQEPTSLALEGRLSWRQNLRVVWGQEAATRRRLRSLLGAEAGN